MCCTSFDLARVRESIAPVQLRWVPRAGSTNEYAARLRRRRELFAPALVVAGSQSAGRGRGHNRWWSNAGCITITLVLPANEHLSLHQLPLVAGWALRNAVADLVGEHRIELKWPNDLLFRRRKLAGLLCERLHRADLIGIGMNVNLRDNDPPASLRHRITSLSQIAGRTLDKTDVLIALVRQLHQVLSRRDEYPFGSILREYDEYHFLRGRRVSVWINRDARPIVGTCQGLDGMGRLLVQQRSEKLRIVSGHVQLFQTH